MNKLIVILGPTASGKSDLAVKLAKRHKGEIISADSRQIYKGLDIGSGKITIREMKGVPHHLLSIANPKRKFTVAQFQKLAQKKIKEIQKKGKLPFLVGGTGFYIQSVVDGITIPEVKPNWRLRKKLSNYKVERLYKMLTKLDPIRAQTIDPKNPHRLIRAIEIVLTTKNPIEKVKIKNQFDTLQIGIKKSNEDLKKAISKRLKRRLKQGMIAEVKKLHKNGLSWKRLEELGLEYRYVAQYLKEKSFDTAQDLSAYQEMVDNIQIESEHFAKRQMTWFKRDKKIKWVKDYKESEKLIKKFL